MENQIRNTRNHVINDKKLIGKYVYFISGIQWFLHVYYLDALVYCNKINNIQSIFQ